MSFTLDVHRPTSSLLVDSGAGASVFSDSVLFMSMHAPHAPTAVDFGKQKQLPVSAIGSVSFLIRVPGHKPFSITLHDVFYVPAAGPGLRIVSVHTLHLHQHGATFDTPPGFVSWHTPSGNVKQTCVWHGNIPYVHVETITRACVTRMNASAPLCFQISNPRTDLEPQHAHARFGHAGKSKLAV